MHTDPVIALAVGREEHYRKSCGAETWCSLAHMSDPLMLTCAFGWGNYSGHDETHEFDVPLLIHAALGCWFISVSGWISLLLHQVCLLQEMFTIVRNLMNELMNDTNTFLSGNMEKQGCSFYAPRGTEQYCKGNDCSRTGFLSSEIVWKKREPQLFDRARCWHAGSCK